MRFFIASLLALSLQTVPTEADEPIEWQHKIGADHPLAGTILRVDDQATVTLDALITAAAAADWLIIGERHDNRDHHLLQALIIEAVHDRDSRSRPVAFEMLDSAQQELVDRHLENNPSDVSGLAQATTWDESGWPDWQSYEPVFSAAILTESPIIAADLTADQIHAVYQEGASGFADDFLRGSGLDRALPEPLEKALQDEIETAHCGVVPRAQLTPMVEVQRARDAMLAHRLVIGAVQAGGILIAGNGHARRDRGVPWYLDHLRPDDRVLSIGLVEVDADIETRLGDMPFDYVWLTPRADDVDPCEAFKDSLKTMSREPGTDE
ncbi:MAG: ChaN family lipoprotein [Pseudomonadota bacterium]